MFLRSTRRKKNGKTRFYWNIEENRRPNDGHVMQRQVLYLGEISAPRREAWWRANEVIDETTGKGKAHTLALPPQPPSGISATAVMADPAREDLLV